MLTNGGAVDDSSLRSHAAYFRDIAAGSAGYQPSFGSTDQASASPLLAKGRLDIRRVVRGTSVGEECGRLLGRKGRVQLGVSRLGPHHQANNIWRQVLVNADATRRQNIEVHQRVH